MMSQADQTTSRSKLCHLIASPPVPRLYPRSNVPTHQVHIYRRGNDSAPIFALLRFDENTALRPTIPNRIP